MKAIFLVPLLLVGCASYKKLKPYEVNRETIRGNITVKKDDFKKKTFVSLIPRRTGNESLFQELLITPYIGVDHKTKKKYPVVRFVYRNSDGWIFLNNVQFICESGSEFTIKPLQVDRQIVYGSSITEQFDYFPKEREFNLLKSCKSGKVRVAGKSSVYDTSFGEKEALYFKEADFILKKMTIEEIEKFSSES